VIRRDHLLVFARYDLSHLRRLVRIIVVGAVAAVPTGLAGAAPPPALRDFGPWAAGDSRVAFEATIGGRHGVWVESFGSNQPKRLGPTCTPGSEVEIELLAAGPDGSWGCLVRVEGNTEAAYSVHLMSSNGATRHVASAGGPTGPGNPPIDSIPDLFGDGTFLGYVHITANGLVRLMRIAPSGHAQHVANVRGVPIGGAIAIGGDHLAIPHGDGTVSVYTTQGKLLATIHANAEVGRAPIALTGERLVVLTANGRLAVYTLRGRRVGSYPVGATTSTADFAASDGYAVLVTSKSVRAVMLSTGADRIVARAGKGWFDGIRMEPPGAVILLHQSDTGRLVTLRFLAMTTVRAAFD
jgi:hypothetical protein